MFPIPLIFPPIVCFNDCGSEPGRGTESHGCVAKGSALGFVRDVGRFGHVALAVLELLDRLCGWCGGEDIEHYGCLWEVAGGHHRGGALLDDLGWGGETLGKRKGGSFCMKHNHNHTGCLVVLVPSRVGVGNS